MGKKKVKEDAPAMVERDCFVCDGTGNMCNECGESSAVCECNTENFYECENCNGIGKVSVPA